MKNRPRVGQELEWISPHEMRGSPSNESFIRAMRARHLGKLKVQEIVDRPPEYVTDHFPEDFFIVITNNGQTVTSSSPTGEPVIFSPNWFHFAGE